jgi:UDP-N-acetylmuramoyl-L-alanyl-D-glutamate--2,6-diaminopimelate ligase
MTLRDLLSGLSGLNGPSGPAADVTEITSVAYDSRQVRPGTLFVAIRGEKRDGNGFVADAIAHGAAAVASEQPVPADLPGGVAWVQVPQARKALATIGANFYGRPAEQMKLVGITGTNGKTTTTYLVDSIVRAAGHASGLLGTISYRTPRGEQTAKNTTPESLDLHRFLAEVRDAGGTHVTLEVSSHALAMDRAWGCSFAVAVFTNLTRDHLDFHKTMEEYFAAKRQLFAGTGAGAPKVGVVNSDDPRGKELVGLAERTITYGLTNGADVITRKFSLSFSGLEFTVQTPVGKAEIRSPLVGRINVYNILAAVATGVALGVPLNAIQKGIADLAAVPGRFERIDEGQPYLVVVDYAHTDDALRNLIQTARELNASGRVIVLFGCGGDRDRTKRPLMGEVAGTLADLVVLTSDNPRSEDPLRIINDALVGLQKANGKYVVEADRERAIELALEEARSGDIVLLAGKGHETYQILGPKTIDFDDREVARKILRSKK